MDPPTRSLKLQSFKFDQGSSRPSVCSPLPRVCRPAEGDQKVQTFHGCCKRLFENNPTRTHALAAFTPARLFPASESLQWHCAAAPFRTTTNEEQHGNVMGNVVRRLPPMQRSRVSLAAAPRLLPSVFSMNEPGRSRGEQRRKRRERERERPQERHAENQAWSTPLPMRGAKSRKIYYVKRKQNAPH